MACKYIYKGRIFNSEIAFDDFLIERKKYESELGDIVFSLATSRSAAMTRLNQHRQESRQVQQKMYDLIRHNKVTYNEDGEMSLEDPPYIGVNRYLSGLTNIHGDLLFPEFREVEYWEGRFNDWKGEDGSPHGKFTDDELALFGYTKGNEPRITDVKEAERMRDKIKEKWKIQAKTGTAMHSVLQTCFKYRNGKYLVDLKELDIIDEVNKSIKLEDAQYLNPDTIKQLVQYAKLLKSDLLDTLNDKDLVFYPEFVVTSDISSTKADKLLGIIDLLVLDSNGCAHIIDYKTSVHKYIDFSDAKKYSYAYQMAVYLRMIEKLGIDVKNGRMLVAPILIEGFRLLDGKYVYNGILVDKSLIDSDIFSDSLKMWDNIDEFLPQPFETTVTGELIGLNVLEIMSEWFPNYGNKKVLDIESLTKELKDKGKLTPNENGMLVYERYYTNEPPITMEADKEAEFVLTILKYRESLPARKLKMTSKIKLAIKEAIKNGAAGAEFPSYYKNNSKESTTWLRDLLDKYTNGIWEVVDNLDVEDYGLIQLRTKLMDGVAPQVDFIRVSTSSLAYHYNSKNSEELKNHRGLTGRYESDIKEKSKSNSLMLEAVNGNVELMETMLIINQLNGLEKVPIGSITIVNPEQANGMQASNEELLYCWQSLNRHKAVKIDKFNNESIKFLSKFEIVRLLFNLIMTAAEANQFKQEYSYMLILKSSKSMLDIGISTNEEQIEKLKELLKVLLSKESKLKEVLDNTYTSRGNHNQLYIDLYNSILIAISKLKGVNFRQLLKDHDKWFESVLVHTKGLSGSYMDNPGNLDSETLNLVTKLVTEAYLNTRDDLQRHRHKILQLVDNLRREKQMGAIALNTLANQVNLYSNMFITNKDGDFLFADPNTLHGAEKEFLEYTLDMINRDRIPDEKERERLKQNKDPRYYRVPLARGGSDSEKSVRGLMSILRTKLSYLLPKNAYENARKKAEGIFNADEEHNVNSSLLLFRMTNMFDEGNDPLKRLDKIKLYKTKNSDGTEYFEHNLETLLYKHLFAYSVLRNIDGVFPMIKAAMIHINNQGSIRNEIFKNDNLYLREYIFNKILNKSIVDPNRLNLSTFLGMIKQAASKMTLAFAPVLALYQPLQGLWQDISLMIRKPDGKMSFTKEHFGKSLKIVYSDLSHFSDSPTLCSSLNEIYGINDMDMNVYAERLSSSKKGIWNFDNLLFKFASRPDYYNRMSIFLCLMLGDGCFEAHKMKNGKLVYDWREDSRFKEFAKNPKGNSEIINELRTRYYAIAKLFVIEHAKDENGNDFVLDMNNPKPLPRAYTNRDAEALKSLCDDIYGYYSHEKKSLVMSTFAGSMWLQFKTYWSGKKNLYLQSGGVRLRGSWEHYEENGKKFYYLVDDSGNILYDLPALAEDNPKLKSKIAPFVQWKGQWLEGIILTLSDMFKNAINNKSFSAGWNSKWNNEDEALRLVYRSNLKQMGYDLFMWLLGGVLIGSLLEAWLQSLKKSNEKDRNFAAGCAIAAANIAVMSVKNSFIDFNFMESVGTPVGLWTPFAFEWGGRTAKTWWNVATGDEDFWDGVVKTSGGLKQIKPMLDTIKPEMFRTEREGGTFGVEA